MTDFEAAELNRGRPDYLPPITPVAEDAKVRVNYENQDGEIVDELAPSEYVRHRARAGENVVATKDTIEIARQDAQSREARAIADEENLTALTNAAVPGMQFIQNAIVGEEEAARLRSELSVNVGMNLVGNLAEMALGTVALGGLGRIALGADRARKVGVITGLNAPKMGAGLGLKRAGQIAVQDALIETHMYVQNQLDTNGPFVAEDWAQQVGTGMLFGSVFAAGAAARGLGAYAKHAIGPGAQSALGTARTALTTMAVLSPKGAEAMKYARASAASGLIGKLMRSVRKRGLAQTDEVADAARQLELDFVHARDQVTPSKLDGMTPTKRAAAMDEYRRYADSPNMLDAVDFDNMVPSIKKMGQAVNRVRQEALKMHRKLHGNGVVDMGLTDKARDGMILHANELLKHVESAGMVDVKNAIKRGIIDSGEDAASMHKALIEAKVNARFRRGVDAGADIVDDKITEFLNNPKVFTKSQIKKNREIIGAVDDVVKVWDDLGEIQIPSRPKDFERFQASDGIAVGKNRDAIARMRAAVDTLAEKGLLSADQRAAFETAMLEASDGISRGTKGMEDAIKINKARTSTLGKLKKERDLAGTVADSPESFAAARLASGLSQGVRIAELAAKGLDAFLSPKPMMAGAGITAAIHGMNKEEKRATFELIHQKLIELAGNPDALIDGMSEAIDRGAGFDPTGADHALQKTANWVFYLQSQLPPVDDTIYGRGAPQPLSAIEEYMEKFLAAADPVAVGWEVYSGTVTPQMVESLRATSPEFYAQMSMELAHVMSRVPADKANPKVVAAANIFLGGMDPMYTGDFIMRLQSNYAQTQMQDQVINGPRQKVNNPGAESSLTTSQRQQTY